MLLRRDANAAVPAKGGLVEVIDVLLFKRKRSAVRLSHGTSRPTATKSEIRW